MKKLLILLLLPIFVYTQVGNDPVGNVIFTQAQKDALYAAFENPSGTFPGNTSGYFDDITEINNNAEEFRSDMSTTGVDRGAMVGFNDNVTLLPRYAGDGGNNSYEEPFPPSWSAYGFGPLYSNRNIHAAGLKAYAYDDVTLAGYVLKALYDRAVDEDLDFSNGGSRREPGEPIKTNSTYGTAERYPFERQETFRCAIGQNPYFQLSSKMEQYAITYSIIYDLVKNTSDYQTYGEAINYWFKDYYRFIKFSADRHTTYWFGSNWRNFQQDWLRPTQAFSSVSAYSDGSGTVLYRGWVGSGQGITNRSADGVSYVHFYGDLFNESEGRDFGYDWFRAMMITCVWADGTFNEHSRWDANPDYIFTHVIKYVLMAHTNEVAVSKGYLPQSEAGKFYNYSTSLGNYDLLNNPSGFNNTAGGPKNLELILDNLSRYYRLPADGGYQGVRYRANGSPYSTTHVQNLMQGVYLSYDHTNTDIRNFRDYNSSAGYTTGLNPTMQANGQGPHSQGTAWGLGQAIGGHVPWGFNAFTSSPPTPTCSDGIQNGDETGVDCGGSCSPCETPPAPCNDCATGSNATKYVPTTTVTAASQGIIYDNYGVDNAATLLQILRDIDSGTFDGVTFESGRVVNFETTVEMAYSFANTNLNSVANGLLTTDGSDRVTFYTDNNICQILTNVPGTGFQNFTFENIKFEHGGSTLSGCGNNNNDASLISLNHSDNGGSYNIYFDNCEFTAPNVYMDGASGFSQAIGGIRDITFKDCYFHDTGRMLFEFFGQKPSDLSGYNPATDARIQRLTISGGDYVRGGLIGELGISIVQTVYNVLIEDIDVADSGAMLEVGVTYAYFDDIRATGSGSVLWIGGIYVDYDFPEFVQGDYVINNLQADVSGSVDMFGGVRDIVIQNSTIETDQSWWTRNTYGTMEINNSSLTLGNNTTNMIRQEEDKANWSISNTEITKSTNAGLWDDRSVVSMECVNVMLDGAESFTSSGYSSLTDVQVYNSGVAGTEFGNSGQNCGNIGYTTPNNPTPTCSDGIQNGDETGVDCGGSCAPCSTPVAQKLFPSLYGAGDQATGGNGRTTYFVTNNNDSGTGSVRAALTAARDNGGGTVLHTVSGTIELTSQISLSNMNNITWIGYTAPDGGVDITGQNVVFNGGNNIIVRGIRFRPDADNQDDGFRCTDCDNAWIDSNSISWGSDEALDMSNDSDNITVSNNFINESKTGMLLGDSDNPALSDNISVYRNVFNETTHRLPNLSTDTQGDIINNWTYNHQYRLALMVDDSGAPQSDINHINNVYDAGATALSGRLNKIYNWGSNPAPPNTTDLKIYSKGNLYDGGLLDDNQGWENYGTGTTTKADAGFFVQSQFSLLGENVPILAANAVKDSLATNMGVAFRLDGSGDKVANRDALDTAWLDLMQNQTGTSYSSSDSGGNWVQNHSSQSLYTNYHGSVTSTPIASHAAGYDSDNDGMPDVWESSFFGDLSNNGTADADGDGISNLYEYLRLYDVNEPGGSTNPPPPTTVTNTIIPILSILLTF